MIESMLVVDDGLGATRVVAACHRSGIKAVLLTTSERANRPHAADDVVLLSAEELRSPQAVIAAAQAADVDAVHPAGGPLAGDVGLRDAARAAGLRAIITVFDDVAAALHAEGVVYRTGEQAELDVVVVGAPGGVVGRVVAGLDEPVGVEPAHAQREQQDDQDDHERDQPALAPLAATGAAAAGHAAPPAAGLVAALIGAPVLVWHLARRTRP